MNLKAIAELAGVSTATVSNVINGNYHKVSQETIQKVQKIIEENDYQPNAVAKSLASKESRIIGVVVPNIDEEHNFFTNTHDAYVLALLENNIRRQGYYLMVRCVTKCEEIIPIFSSWNVDGMIFFGTFKSEVETIRNRLKVPTVFIDTYAEELDVATVGIDDYKGGVLAARYLLGKGHRTIAFVGPDHSRGVIQQRYQGFCDACAEKGIEITEQHVFEADTTYKDGISVGQKIAFSDIKFTAVAVMSDTLAFGVMEGLRLCGLNVPEDISVMGFDNLPECNYSNPKLTSISQKGFEKARLASECLFEMIREKKKIVTKETVDVEIVERMSVREI
jgi:LacI family transcriptional regulator